MMIVIPVWDWNLEFGILDWELYLMIEIWDWDLKFELGIDIEELKLGMIIMLIWIIVWDWNLEIRVLYWGMGFDLGFRI